jgi:hypothetical protein
MKIQVSFRILLFTSLSYPTIQASSSSSMSDFSLVSSVSVASPIKQPNAIDHAQMLLRKSTISTAERDKAIALLEAKKPLVEIEEARRRFNNHSEDLKELERKKAQSSSNEQICLGDIKKYKSMQDAAKGSHKGPVFQQIGGNESTSGSRAEAILSIISTAQSMLKERVHTGTSHNQACKKIEQLLDQIKRYDNSAKKTSTRAIQDDDDNDDLDEFLDIEVIASERFESDQEAEQRRMVAINAKHLQIGAVLTAIEPLPEMFLAEVVDLGRQIDRVNIDIAYAEESLKNARDDLSQCEELIKRLKSKTLS